MFLLRKVMGSILYTRRPTGIKLVCKMISFPLVKKLLLNARFLIEFLTLPVETKEAGRVSYPENGLRLMANRSEGTIVCL